MEMSYSESTGLYSINVPAGMTNIIFNNNAGTQTGDLSIVDNGLYQPDGSVAPRTNGDSEKIVYFDTENCPWSTVYAYWWNANTGENNGWPGTPMSYTGYSGLYSIEVPGDMTHIIFNNNKGQQTNDLPIPASGSIYHGDIWVGYEGDPTIQDEDRPGVNEALEGIDANNVYGYDPAYGTCQTHSLGGTRFVTVDRVSGAKAVAPTATFTFTGTGFDVVGLTDSDSGAIWVQVTDEDGDPALDKNGNGVSYIVNTYYGYSYKLCKVVYTKIDGVWKLTHVEPAAEGAKEQIAQKPADAAERATSEGVEYRMLTIIV